LQFALFGAVLSGQVGPEKVVNGEEEPLNFFTNP